MDTAVAGNDEELLHSLRELAMDLHWTWSHSTDKVWRQLDPRLWDLTHNPLVVLQTVSRNRIREVVEDPLVRAIIEELMEAKRQRSFSPAWFQKVYPESPLKDVAYFSMEYMLSEALPIYSGGLGNVSGDLLKTASDLGVPLTGIGLLYQQGYPRQVIYRDGTQQYVSPYNDPGQLPISPLRSAEGEWLRIEIPLPGYSLWLRTWKVQVGRTTLLLLDSNDAANLPQHRGITSELYGSDPELMLLQKIILGIGGWRLLKALGMDPQVCHVNEAHAAFVILERARNFMVEKEQPFAIALNVTRSGSIFTTHTAVGAGFDLFSPALIEKYLGSYIRDELKLSLQDFLALGRKNPGDASESFNTAFLAIRGTAHVNGVSRLHAQVSRKLFAPLFPGWPIAEVPIDYVTNGVHMPTWDSPEADKLWTEACGKERWLGSLESLEKNISQVSDERLWTLRTHRSEAFIEDIREHYSRQLATIGGSAGEIAAAGRLFDPSILTLGFARRFVRYKRPGLLLHDPARLRAILASTEKPVQLVLAGKPHPMDLECRNTIRDWIRFIHDNDLQERVVFLSDYDMLLTEQMVQGVDVWINTPRRPWEACGTSGMKVLVNGGLNLSEPDGWWDEAYSPEVGWTFGNREEVEDDRVHDAEDAGRLYEILEKEIIPLFYHRNGEGIPTGWVGRMRQSMARLTFHYSSSRSLQEYTEKYYLPASLAYAKRAEALGEAGKIIRDWKSRLDSKWEGIHFDRPSLETREGFYYFTVPVFLNGIGTGEVAVELYANEMNGQPVIRQKMEVLPTMEEGEERVCYSASVPADRPAAFYTPRIIPVHPLAAIPLESSHILWQH
ncbi:MAG: alpha-glucan family phosphorylase [Flavisolibacter sp.]